MIQEEGSSSGPSSPLEFLSWMQLSPGLGSPYVWLRDLKSEDRGLFLIRLIYACTNHVASGSIKNADTGLEFISHLASPVGDTVQRIATYFSEGLAYRMVKHLPGVYKALNSTKISSISEEPLVQKLFFDLFPFLKLAYVITNQAIIEAMDGEKIIHIIDLNSFEAAQWIDIMRTLSGRPEGPPHLKITGIHERKEVLEKMAAHLTKEAEDLRMPFQFNPVVSKLENVDVESLGVKTGEALAISSVLQLHSLLASDDEILERNSPAASKNLQKVVHMKPRTLEEWIKVDMMNAYMPSPDSVSSPVSLSASPKMGSSLTALRNLSPKVMVVTEQESNLNGCNLMERVTEALHFYGALFDCLESTVSRTSIDRQKVEKMLFGEEIKSIIACEGVERKERHEKLEKWILRLEIAGFGRVPLSYHGMLLAKRLLYDGYNIKEENGCLVICWHERPLFSVSAWGLGRYD
ncbi:Scarecrow-like protein 3 [Quillaja saponaria]|uniref:Scarecrow-like protein 3 n=1 Tax=Quillaja saponaria TaxID=32244 RepID=A0AAD7PBZ3_QUISA|nr:Scarecrow-like protein 3 [Quillaja saponaria]